MENKIWTAKNILIIIGLVIMITASVLVMTLYCEKYYLANKYKVVSVDNNYQKVNGSDAQVPLGEVAKEGTYFAPTKLEPLPYGTVPQANAQVKWNGSPIKLSDLKLIVGYRDDSNSGGSASQDISYYEMGKNGSNSIILAMSPTTFEMGSSISDFFFEKRPAENGRPEGYVFINKASSDYVYNGKENRSGYLLSPTILSEDTNIYYQGIVGPLNLSWKGMTLQNTYSYSPADLFSNYLNSIKSNKTTQIDKVDSISLGDIYLQKDTRARADTDLKFYSQRFFLKLPSGFYTSYEAGFSFFSDNSIPNITWESGGKNIDAYSQDAKMGGCGGGGYTVYAGDLLENIKIAGTTNNGETVYEFKDVNNPIVKFFYNVYGGKIYDYTNNVSSDISIGDWFTHHPVILYKNGLGDYVIFTSQKYGVQAECGKPVIYLYPEKTTNVKVRVGASVTKSEPLYNNGWQVIAKANGAIVNSDGKIYDSLFWEGIGDGNYPDVKSGFIVRQDKIESEIKLQLSELGLNEKESKDFMEFWLPKMPKTPFVRLTWFVTEEINKLAPLYVYPKPDTVIRIFLDFKGLDKPINLPEQKLTSLSRQGFTVVEWGGLLIK